MSRECWDCGHSVADHTKDSMCDKCSCACYNSSTTWQENMVEKQMENYDGNDEA